MKGYKFGSLEDAQQYLSGSIIRVNYHPVYVSHIGATGHGRDLTLEYYPLDTVQEMGEKVEVLPLYHYTINLSPVPLGMMNVKRKNNRGSVVSVSRMPRRMWKIGLTHRNVDIVVIDPEADVSYIDTSRLIYSRWLTETIINHFPTIEKAKDKLNNGWDMIAFSRNFAFDRKERLYYKRFKTSIGVIDERGAKLHEDYQYLTQLLEMDGLRCL